MRASAQRFVRHIESHCGDEANQQAMQRGFAHFVGGACAKVRSDPQAYDRRDQNRPGRRPALPPIEIGGRNRRRQDRQDKAHQLRLTLRRLQGGKPHGDGEAAADADEARRKSGECADADERDPVNLRVADAGRFFRLFSAPENHQRIKRGEIENIGPLQEDGGDFRRRQRAADAARDETDRQQRRPAKRNAGALLPIAPDAGEAGWEYLRDQRDALRDMLFGAEQENGEYHQSPAGADAKQPGRHAADKADAGAGKEGAEKQCQTPLDAEPACASPSNIASTTATQESTEIASPHATCRTKPWNSATSERATASALRRRGSFSIRCARSTCPTIRARGISMPSTTRA